MSDQKIDAKYSRLRKRNKLYRDECRYLSDKLRDLRAQLDVANKRVADIDAAVAAIRERCDCGVNSCMFASPRTGMRTNGGCRCWERHSAQLLFRRLLQACEKGGAQ